MASAKMIPCHFFARGLCKNGDACAFVHERNGSVPKHLRSVGTSFPAVEKLNVNPASAIYFEEKPKLTQGQELDDNFTRELAGASVYFNEFGNVSKISLPTDFSIACITGLPPGTTPEAVVDILHGLGFNLDVDCIGIARHAESSGTKATVKVENPSFAKELSARLLTEKSVLSATPIPIDTRQTSCRKTYISWHKATRSVWVNFGNEEIAGRVARKFNSGRYKCLGQSVKSSVAKRSPAGRGRNALSHNPVAWTILLSDVPGGATENDIQGAIKLLHDKPRHVEMGPASYHASDGEVSVEVRSRLEEHGPLESFYLAPTSEGKRVKATAWFLDEAGARSACSLNNGALKILGKGKLTVTLVQSAKIKVSTRIYLVSKSRIDNESKAWREHHLAFNVYLDHSQRFTTLKVTGGSIKDLANARKSLDEILTGVLLADGEKAIWCPRNTFKKLKAIEKDLGIIITRDKSKRQLHFHGPPEKFQQAVRHTTDMLKEEAPTTYEIDLKPDQFSWAIHGGFSGIEQAMGKGVAVFNVVSRSITVHGVQQEYETAIEIMEGKRATDTFGPSKSQSRPEGCCPICFCEPDDPVQTSCKHTYCLDCLEEYCKSAASTIKDGFQIKCQGDEGACPTTAFMLRELKDYLSSSVFESVLNSSFEEYIQRRPEAFRYCPTPDCGYIYRCMTAPGSQPAIHTCPNCLEAICTSCCARHGVYTCAEYKDIASGGHEALTRLKKELNIKDCPKCTTPMEKTEGCNHVTCGGCRAHICWVCLEVFAASEPCYKHMNSVHGGIGLDNLLDF